MARVSNRLLLLGKQGPWLISLWLLLQILSDRPWPQEEGTNPQQTHAVSREAHPPEPSGGRDHSPQRFQEILPQAAGH